MLGEFQKQFIKVSFPKYLENLIQEIAFEHLKVKDMGKLRDSFGGQSYFDKLKKDLMAEYAFEKVIGQNFDWKKRKNKDFLRLKYEFEGKNLRLVPFSSTISPIIKFPPELPIVLVFQKQDNSNFVSGIISTKIISWIPDHSEEYLDLSKSGVLKNQGAFLPFSDFDEFNKSLQNAYTL